jgi:hypothetical protein
MGQIGRVRGTSVLVGDDAELGAPERHLLEGSPLGSSRSPTPNTQDVRTMRNRAPLARTCLFSSSLPAP